MKSNLHTVRGNQGLYRFKACWILPVSPKAK